jgi:hypothetical protein
LADNPARLTALWTGLCEVLLAHLDVFEEILFLPLLSTVTDRRVTMRQLNAQKLDILEAVAEARLQPPGSPLWRLAVRAVRATASQHISTVETSRLPGLCRQTPEGGTRQLAY